MKITVHNPRSYITEFPPSPWDKNLLSAFTRKSSQTFWAAKRTPGWSGATHFISEKKGMMATGILPMVLDWAKKEDIEVEITDKRVKPARKGVAVGKNMLKNIELRDYQLDAINAAVNNDRGLVKAPTGSGKTVIATGLCAAYWLPTLVIVDRVNLSIQTRDKMVEYGLKAKDIGIIGDKFNEQGRMITITTIQSAHKLEDINKFQVVIADESHHTKAKSYIALLKNMENAYYRFGLSGTIFGDDPVDDMYRITQFGPLLYEIPTQVLIEAGVLSKPTIRMIEINKPNVEYVTPYMNQYKVGIAQNRYRNFIIAKFANNFRGKTLVLFRLIEHGQLLKDLVPNAMYLDGDTPVIVRDRMIKEFNTMVEGTMLASTIFDEGVDFSSIENLILAGGEKSPIKGIQRLGRGLRSNGPGDTVNVIDFMDRTSTKLQRHSKKRMKLYKSEGHQVKVFLLGDEYE